MRTLRHRLQATAAVIGTVATITFGTPVQAQAATGWLHISRHDSILNPPKGCHRYWVDDVTVVNNTNATISFYGDVECFTNAIKIIHAGQQGPIRGVSQSYLVWG
ncbi:hypothetical protein [Nonomuraea longicatena]|uniref:Uncharacterized protein n=1 Tax=Nonomuraea longicatena TaxID=83682 RepID=A0ABP4BR51_9ACTN